jgi:tetratricopeptide (TPR) repeat protein
MTQPTSRIRRAADPSPGAPRRRFQFPRWAAAAPALLTMAVVLVLAIAALAQRSDSTDAGYQQDAQAAMESGDFETARVCYERLLQHSPTDPALLFGLAKTLLQLGHPADAIHLIQRLAPTDAAGYAPAQVVIAEQILSNDSDPNSLQLAQKHVERALESDPNNGQALLLLNRLSAKTSAH